MTKSIYSIVGARHRGTEKLLASLPVGEPLTLVREPNNQYDPKAVMVWARDKHIAYIAAKENGVLSQFIDQHGHHWTKPVELIAPTGADITAGDTIEIFKAVKAKLAVSADRWPMAEVDE